MPINGVCLKLHLFGVSPSLTVYMKYWLSIITLVVSLSLSSQNFITTWNSSSGLIKIPGSAGLTYNYNVSWTNLTNSGVSEGSETHTTDADNFIAVEANSLYRVEISGVYPHFNMNDDGTYAPFLQSIEQWGNISWESFENAFYGCSNLTYNASDTPDLSGVTNMSSAFREATNFNGNIGGWDVSTIQNMSSMFRSATNFNQDISAWDVSSVTDMSGMFFLANNFNNGGQLLGWDANTAGVLNMSEMFRNAARFNQPIGTWNVGMVQNMGSMFFGTADFNQDISDWNVGNVTDMSSMFRSSFMFDNGGQPLDWGNATSNVQNMTSMFEFGSAFSQDISDWDVSSVTNTTNMFRFLTTLDPDLSAWDMSSLTTATNMFSSSGLTSSSYDDLLIGWSARTLQNGVAFNVGVTYCNGADARQSIIDNFSWGFTDGGESCATPGTQVSDISVTSVLPTSMTINWTNGDGGNRLVVMREGSAVDATPTNATTYTANSAFGTGGTELGTGNYVVYNGSGSSVGVTGLTGGNTYHIRVFEFNGVSGSEVYNVNAATGNPISQATPGPFVTTWSTTDGEINIPTKAGETYNYNISWTNLTNATQGDGSATAVTGDHLITGLNNGDTYEIEITGTFPAIQFNNDPTDRVKILTVDQWGGISWLSLANAFYGCSNLTITAVDAPDLSLVTDMSSAFHNASMLNQSIDHWDVSNVQDFSNMFRGASIFNQPLNSWTVTSALDMSQMFRDADDFNQNLNSWVPSSVTTMFSMFYSADVFDGAIGNWDVSSVTNMRSMFFNCTDFNQPLAGWGGTTGMVQDMSLIFQNATSFNQPLNAWDVSSVQDMDNMFDNATAFNQNLNSWVTTSLTSLSQTFKDAVLFNGQIDNWDVDMVTNFFETFEGAKVFNQPLNNWVVTGALNMRNMFSDADAFNQDLNLWTPTSVTDMRGMFSNCLLFNGDITTWDVTTVDDMGNMFFLASAFNRPIGSWAATTGGVMDMGGMFRDAIAFDQDLGAWDVSSVTDMANMFDGAIVFNQDISGWTTSNVQLLSNAFRGASAFDQNLGSWDLSSATTLVSMLNNSGMSVANYDATLIGWEAQNPPTGLTLGATGLNFCNAVVEHTELQNPGTHNWTINDAGQDCVPFITTWLATADGQFTIPTDAAETYYYNVYWENIGNAADNGSLANQTGDAVITGLTDGATYRVEITGRFDQLYFNNGGDKDKILTIEQWGDVAWVSMSSAFEGCTNLTYNAVDAPDLTGVTSLHDMFKGCSSFNGNLSNWDVSTITSFSSVFQACSSFNQPLNTWDVSAGQNFSDMFYQCTIFDQNLDNWMTTSATNMNGMFYYAEDFNGNIVGFDTDQVTTMSYMFEGARAFNQNISGWDVSNVSDMSNMFRVTDAFNQPIGAWTPSSLTNVEGMFYQADAFNQNMPWTLSGVSSFYRMFKGADLFNGTVNSLVTSFATDIHEMFDDAAAFNQDVSGWDVSNVTDFSLTFLDAVSFNQNLGAWDISSATTMANMLDNTNLTVANYDATLTAWAAQAGRPSGITIGVLGLQYCNAIADRAILTGDTWNLVGDAQGCPFITRWLATGGSITIPTRTGVTYDYDVYIENIGNAADNFTLLDQTGDAAFTGITDGATYRVEITKDFPRIYFHDGGEGQETAKLLTIESWGDIKWESMSHAFSGCANMTYNGVDNPDLSLVTNLGNMFENAVSFNGNINGWNVSTIQEFNGMFAGATIFDQNLDNWVTSSALDMSNMFYYAEAFDGDITGFDTDMVVDMHSMFEGARAFNQNITGWNVAMVQDMSDMFRVTDNFNQPIGSWIVPALTTVDGMFYEADAFNQDIPWTLSGVSSFYRMFEGANLFNGQIPNLVTATATDLTEMLRDAIAFDQDISAWDVSSVINMSNLFDGATSFNQNISGWTTSNVQLFGNAFSSASAFNQDLGNWNLSSATALVAMLDNAGLSADNYDATLIGWEAQNPPTGLSLGATGLHFCNAEAEHTELQNPATHNWTITDAGQECAFITTWSTSDNQIIIPTTGTGYNYDILWTNLTNTGVGDGSASGVTDADHPYTISGLQNTDVYRLEITGNFPRFYAPANGGDARTKIRSVEQWGDIAWSSMFEAFHGCTSLTVPATDAPDLSGVTDLTTMFFNCDMLNNPMDHWDVSTITDFTGMFQNTDIFNQDLNSWTINTTPGVAMESMFNAASSFNGNISTWNVIGVTNMSRMFNQADAFTGNISNWDTDNVTTMFEMFAGTDNFNTPIGSWVVSNVTNMGRMFQNTTAFNQDLNWNISSVTNFSEMFEDASAFQGDLSSWTTNFSSNPINMSQMFRNAGLFNSDISSWDFTTVTSMQSMFENADAFNRNINNWDVSTVTNLSGMFSWMGGFNQPLNNWTINSSANLSAMFYRNTAFNQDISTWVLTGVSNLFNMFSFADAFNQPIGTWDVSTVQSIGNMFQDADSFDQDLGAWDISNVVSGGFGSIFSNSGMSAENYDATLIGWADDNGGTQTIPTGVSLNASGVFFCDDTGRQDLIDNYSWTINDAGQNCSPDTYYSTGVIAAFDTPSVWNSERDGSGTAPIASDFTNGLASFVLQADDGVQQENADININNLTVEDGSLPFQIGDQNWTINGTTTIEGSIRDGVNGGSMTFMGPIVVESDGSFAVTGSNTSFFYFHDDIINRGSINLQNSTQWYIEAPLSIACENGSLQFAQPNSGLGFINADLTLSNTVSGENVSLYSNSRITVADGVTITNQIIPGLSENGYLTIQGMSSPGTATFINDVGAHVNYHPNNGFPSQNINFDVDATASLFRYLGNDNQDLIDTRFYHLTLSNIGTLALTNDLEVLGNFRNQNGSVFDPANFNLTIGGDLINLSGRFTVGGTVTFNGGDSEDQNVEGDITFSDVIVNRSGSTNRVDIVEQSDVVLEGTLTLQQGILNVQQGADLELTPTSSITVGSPDASTMITLEGTITQYTNALGSWLFPVGTTGEYTPLILDLNAGTTLDGAAGSRFVRLALAGVEEPNVLSSGVSLSKYWTLTTQNISNVNGDVTFEYDDSEVNGVEANYVSGIFNGAWTVGDESNVDENTNTVTVSITGSLDGNYTAGERSAFMVEPEIEVYQGVDNTGTALADGQAGSVDFGSSTQGSDITLTFAIDNSGTSVLTISSIVSSAAEFTISGAPATVAVGATETFDITLDASGIGNFNGSITINSDDLDEGSFTFPVNGSITAAPEPEIEVYVGQIHPSTILTDGQTTDVDLGKALNGTDITVPFFIENTGSADLTISSISSDQTEFTIVGAPTSVGAGSSETFDIVLDGAVTGIFNAAITINNDDSDENPFTFPVMGQITEPEIEVYFGNDNSGTPITNGQAAEVDIGSTPVGNNLSETFAVENTGTSVLTISSVTSSDPNFTILSAPATVTEGATEQFFVELDGTTAGIFTSTITINNDDLDENPFIFDVTGEIIGDAEPEIEVFFGSDNSGVAITSGGTTIYTIGTSNLGENIDALFAIENSGDADLTISGISSSNAVFVVSQAPMTVSSGNTETFTVTLQSSTAGNFLTDITIGNDDSDEATFTFKVLGEIIENPETKLHVYNVVTPNGDGRHDFLKIVNIEQYPGNRVTVFDRWGRKVFTGEDYDNTSVRFEGRNTEGNGAILPEGTYFYVIITGSEKTTGFLQLSTSR